MASIPTPFEITYGGQAVGGSSGVFQIHGPHSFSRTREGISLEFIVVVVATSYADLDNQSATLEAAFTKRDQTLTIDLNNVLDAAGASTTTYTFGTGFLNSRATCDKTGDEDTDRGVSRSYAIQITGGLPSDDTDGSSRFTGLQTISYNLNYEASRQKKITISGVYTATPAQTSPVRAAMLARANYEDATTGIDAEATAYFLNFAGEVFELVTDTVDEDRTNHQCSFSRTYLELLDDQTAGTRDATNIRDHDFSMTEVIDQPGDSAEDVFRLRRVLINYDCAVDITQGVDIKDTVFQTQVRPHLIQTFRDTFTPSVFGVEARQVDYDRTRQRLSVSMTIAYQKAGGDDTVELQTSVRLTENQNHQLTPTHERNPFAFDVAKGWTDRIRTTTTAIGVIGEDPGSKPGGSGPGGDGRGGRIAFAGSGEWVEVSRDREARSHWIGDPDEETFLMTLIDEVLVEQYFETPKGST